MASAHLLSTHTSQSLLLLFVFENNASMMYRSFLFRRPYLFSSGEKMPVDGEIVEGRCSVDESMLTGEPRLVPKEPGSLVTGGTISYEGAVSVRATTTGQASTLSGEHHQG